MTTIGIITNDAKPVFQRDLITGIRAVAREQGWRVIVDAIAEDPAQPKPVSLDIGALDGVIIIANVLDDDAVRAIHATGTPVTLISHQVDGAPVPAIIQNNREGIRELVEYLVIHCGRRRFVSITGDMRQHDAIERADVLEQTLMQHDIAIPPHRQLRGDFIPATAVQSMQALLERDRDFDAVIAADFLMAVAVLPLLEEHGLSVPDDVCVAGFGDGPEAEAAGLTTVAADIVELGRRAARLLRGQMDGRHIRGVTWLNAAVIERKTCCSVGEE